MGTPRHHVAMGDPTQVEVPAIYGGYDNSYYVCPLAESENCAYTTVLPDNVRSHLRSGHKSTHGWAPIFVFRCSKCPFVVRDRNTKRIDAHWRSCTDDLSSEDSPNAPCLRCPDCERTFFHARSVNTHRRQEHGHSSQNQQPKQRVYNLSLEYEAPDKPLPLVCPVCVKAGDSRKITCFRTVTKLQNHMRDHHDARCVYIVTCGLCGEVAPPAPNLRAGANHYRHCRPRNFACLTADATLPTQQTENSPQNSPALATEAVNTRSRNKKANRNKDIRSRNSDRQNTTQQSSEQHTSRPASITSTPPRNIETEPISSPVTNTPHEHSSSQHTSHSFTEDLPSLPPSPIAHSSPIANPEPNSPEIAPLFNSIETSNSSAPLVQDSSSIYSSFYESLLNDNIRENQNFSNESTNPVNQNSSTIINDSINFSNTSQPVPTPPTNAILDPEDFAFTVGSIEEARASLANLVRVAQASTIPFGEIDNCFDRWCLSATEGFAKKRPTQDSYNRKAMNRSLHNREVGARHRRSRYRKNVALRKAFQRDQKATVREILEGKDSRKKCPISGEMLGKKFRETYNLPADQRDRRPLPEWMNSNSQNQNPDASNTQPPLCEGRIDADEVLYVLASRDMKSAPGPDGLSYAFWRTLDPEGKSLAGLFELCRSRGRIFRSWRKSRVSLICKDPLKDLHQLSTWRPIAVCNTVYRLYTGVISRRIARWCKANNIISPSQKGFMPEEGVFEHLFLLDEIIADAKMGRRACSITWLDLRNAFGSVRPDTIVQMLQYFDAPSYLVNIVEDLYKPGSCSLRGGDGQTVEVPIEKGVRQGCPLSGILFNLVLEVLLRGLKSDADGYTMGRDRNHLINALAYADDICIVTKSRQQMIKQLTRCEKFARWAGFEFNNAKSGAMTLRWKKGARCRTDTQALPFCNGEIKMLSPGEFYKYLGANTGHFMPCSNSTLVTRTHDQILRLFVTPLLPGQKLLALKRFIIPALRFHLRVRPFTQKDLGMLDRTIRRCVRLAYRLPINANTAFFHAPCRSGGLGIPCLAAEADVLVVSHVFKMLSAPDKTVSEVAFSRLKWFVERKKRRPATREDMAAMLSGHAETGERRSEQSVNSGAPRDLYSRIQRSSRRLGVTFASKESSFALTIGSNQLDSTGRCAVTKALHQHQNLKQVKTWNCSPSQGKAVEMFSKHSCSNHWINDPTDITCSTQSFCFKARLSLLPTLNVVARFNREIRPLEQREIFCRLCGHVEETLGHVLNGCKELSRLHTHRHNAVQNLLVEAIPPDRIADIQVDKVCDHHRDMSGSLQRPDIVITANDGNVTVIDVACPYVNCNRSLQVSADKKIRKYELLCTNIKHRTGKEVDLYPFIIGSLGSYHTPNDALLRHLGISPRAQTVLRKKVVLAAIKGSHEVWREFITRCHEKRQRRIEEEAREIGQRRQPPDEGNRSPRLEAQMNREVGVAVAAHVQDPTGRRRHQTELPGPPLACSGVADGAHGDVPLVSER